MAKSLERFLNHIGKRLDTFNRENGLKTTVIFVVEYEDDKVEWVTVFKDGKMPDLISGLLVMNQVVDKIRKFFKV